MASQVMNPFKPEHCEGLNCVLNNCSECEQLLNALEAAGLNVADLKADNEANRKLAESLKRSFFPNVP